MLDVDQSINNIELSIHIYQCILHISEKMSIDLVLYRGFTAKKKYELQNYIDFKKLKKRKKESKHIKEHLQQIRSNYIIEHINELQKLKQELKLQEEER